MSARLKQALQHKPKKPLNAYFRLRGQKYKDYGEHDNDKKGKFKLFWESISEEQRDKHNQEFAKDTQTWKEATLKWQQDYKITADELKDFNRKKKEESDGQKSKPSKGNKADKVNISKSKNPPNKSKSKNNKKEAEKKSPGKPSGDNKSRGKEARSKSKPNKDTKNRSKSRK